VSRKRAAKLFGQSLMYVGIIVLLIGVFVSAGAKSTQTITDVKPSTPVEGVGVRLEISNFTVSNSQSSVYTEQVNASVPECSTINSDITIHYLGKTYQESLSASFYPNYGLVLRPLILTTETGDVYLHLDYTDSLYESLTQSLIGNNVLPESVVVTVQTSPFIYLVWGGVALMVFSISLQVATASRERHERPD
jgi:cytochrome c biogenesis factor